MASPIASDSEILRRCGGSDQARGMKSFHQETISLRFHGVGLNGMDATELVSGTMLQMYRVLQTARTSQRLSENPNLPVSAQ